MKSFTFENSFPSFRVRFNTKRIIAFSGFALLLSFSTLCEAQTYTNLISMDNTINPKGGNPNQDLTLAGNFLYGTAASGGTNNDGVLFSYNIVSFAYTTIENLDNNTAPEGLNPLNNVIDVGGVLYGTTEKGGANGNGTLFSYNITTHIYADLVDFNGTTFPNGTFPTGALVAVGNILYGTTSFGGTTADFGTIFSYNISTSTFSSLISFNASNGKQPAGTLINVGGILYGMASQGGNNGVGDIFSFNTVSSAFADVFDFASATGDNPQFGHLVQKGSKLYGMTEGGGANTFGCIFSFDTTGKVYTDLFDFHGTDGSFPFGSLTLSGNTLFGMTLLGGTANDGNIFSFNILTNTITNLFSFGGGVNGNQPYGSLTLSGSTFYGMTQQGGVNGDGNIFSFSPACTLAATVSTTNVSCNGVNNGNATAIVTGGTTPYTFSWVNASSAVVSTTNPSGAVLSAGSYTLTVTDNTGICSLKLPVIITQPAAALAITISSHTNELCNGGSNGSATADSATGGTKQYTYTWTPNGGTNITASNLSAGTYTITAKDANGCTAIASVSLTQPALIRDSMIAANIVNISCNGGSNGSLTAGVKGGTLPYTYSWAPLSGTKSKLTGLTAGTYTIFITDKNECTSTSSFTMPQPAAIRDSVVSLTGPTCNGGDNGIAIIGVKGGITPYTFAWSPNVSTTATSTTLKAEPYTVTVKDKNNCSQTVIFTVTQPLAVSVSILSSTGALCSGGNTGSATANSASGGTSPYTYRWTPSGGTNQTASGLTAGTYTITAKDVNGCTGSASVSVTQPGIIRDSMIAADIVKISCSGGSNGSLTAGVKGGTLPYTYSWAPLSGTKSKITGLTAGTYTIFTTDKNGCTSSSSLTMTQPAAIRDSVISLTNPSCNGEDNGTATIGVKGGTTPYTFTWTSGVSTTSSASNLKAQAYTVTVKDKNGCSLAVIFSLSQPLAIRDSIVTTSKVNVNCNGGNNGSATTGAKFGTPPYTFNWIPTGGTNATANGLTAGNYTVHITDKNGCTASVLTTITQPIHLSDSISSLTCTGNTSNATVSVKGGSVPYTYLWNPGGGTKATMTGLSNGVYTITVTDKNGCSATTGGNFDCTIAPPAGKQDENKDITCCPDNNNISLYPNPNTGQFTLSGLENGMLIEVYDYTGKRVSNITANNNNTQFNLSNQPNGIYLVRIISKDGKVVSQKKVAKTN